MKRKLDFNLPKGKTTEAELLVYIMEEASEVVHAASKCLRFGIDTVWPGMDGKTNYDCLENEYEDLSIQMHNLSIVRQLLKEKDEFGNSLRNQDKYPLAAHAGENQ